MYLFHILIEGVCFARLLFYLTPVKPIKWYLEFNKQQVRLWILWTWTSPVVTFSASALSFTVMSGIWNPRKHDAYLENNEWWVLWHYHCFQNGGAVPDAFVQLKSCGWADVKRKKMCLSVKTNQEMLGGTQGQSHSWKNRESGERLTSAQTNRH